jgi:hypothetical protein
LGKVTVLDKIMHSDIKIILIYYNNGYASVSFPVVRLLSVSFGLVFMKVPNERASLSFGTS